MATVTRVSALLLAAAAVAPLMAAEATSASATGTDPAVIVPLSKATFFLMEDFETTDVGKIPKGFTSVGSVGVVDDVAHTGRHSLRLNAAVSGPRQIVWQGPALTAMGGEHWGRLFYRVRCPRRCRPAAASIPPSWWDRRRARWPRTRSRCA